MTYVISPAKRDEQMYICDQSVQIQAYTGYIGMYSTSLLTPNKRRDYETWKDARANLKTEEFLKEKEKLLCLFRQGHGENTFLKDVSFMASYCLRRPSARIDGDGEEYAFRLNSQNYTYIMRLSPLAGDYGKHFVCYCYRKDWFDQHLTNAKRGIRFIKPDHTDLFRIPDGGSIVITDKEGRKRTMRCRYNDDYHFETDCKTPYHIAEFAERMAINSCTVEPIIVE